MILSPHDPVWLTEFAALQAVYASALGDLILRIEHVGSTAVPNLMAKPILDIDIVMPDYQMFPRIITVLGTLGYKHNGDQGIRHREAFNRADSAVPYTHPPRTWMQHYLYVCPADSEELRRHVAFRDALRARPDWREQYETAKRDIASRSAGDRKTYAKIKEIECCALVKRILAAARTTP